ncbi:MAG: DMT family transporter, partial [Leptolyngbyaceae cyanobacterium bins.59]|nr:DMT family transporter [Leptolyngbyaceae cyanobacterium bins.59]
IAFNRFWITALVLGVWQGINRLRPSAKKVAEDPGKPTLKPFWLIGGLIAAGFLFTADLVLWGWSLTQTTVANATLLANLTPLFTTLGAWLIWGKTVDARFLGGLGIALGGMAGLTLTDLHMASDRFQGDGAALLAALAFGIYLLILEKLQTYISPNAIILWSSAIAAVITLPFVCLSEGPLLPQSWQEWLIVIGLALVCQILGQGLLVYSLRHLSSEFIALFLLLDPVLAAIGAGILFAEQLSFLNWLAFSIVLVGIYLAMLSPSATQEPIRNEPVV